MNCLSKVSMALIMSCLCGGTQAEVSLQNTQWQTPQMLDATKIYKALHSADMNGDGKDELLAGSGSDGQGLGIGIWSYNRTNGTWILNETITGLDYDPHDIVTGDFNKDGRMDVAVSMRFYGLRVFLNQGAGQWASLYLDSRYANNVEVADLDRDGNLDILYCPGGWGYGYDYYATSYYGDGAGHFTNGGGPLCPQPSGGCAFSLVDINHDGFLDLMGGSAEWLDGQDATWHFRAYLNQGNRSWSSSLVEPINDYFFTREHTAGDINEDGFVDCAGIVYTPAGEYKIAVAWGGVNTNYTWEVQELSTFSNSLDWLKVSDLNNDHHLDIIVPGYENFNGVKVYYGNGQGNVSEPQSIADEYARVFKTGVYSDYNGDGRNDIVFSSYPTPRLGVVLSKNNLILWNKLGSDYEVTHSEIGPNLGFAGDVNDQIVFEPCKFNNGFRSESRWQGVTVPKEALNPTKGCYEMWFRSQVTRPVAYQYGRLQWLDQLVNGAGGCLHLVWDDATPYGGLNNQIDVTIGDTEVFADNPPTFTAEIGRLYHIALVWDIHGIDGSSDTARLYIDGNLIAASTVQYNPIAGNGPGYIGRIQNQTPGWSDCYGKLTFDNLKIWGYAKTDFSDRFNEGSQKTLILWNKLGSECEVTNSEIGPNGVLIGAVDYLAAQDGNGIKPQPNPGYYDNPMNYVDFPNLQLSQVGSMEFWYWANWVQPWDGCRNILEYGVEERSPSMIITYNDWQDLCAVAAWNQNQSKATIIRFSPASTPQWTTARPMHFKVVWDGTSDDEKMKFYIDGVQVGDYDPTSNYALDDFTPDSRLRLGSRLRAGQSWWHYWRGDDGIIDDIKVYDDSVAGTPRVENISASLYEDSYDNITLLGFRPGWRRVDLFDRRSARAWRGAVEWRCGDVFAGRELLRQRCVHLPGQRWDAGFQRGDGVHPNRKRQRCAAAGADRRPSGGRRAIAGV